MQFVNMHFPGSLKSILERNGKGNGHGNGQVGMQFVNMLFSRPSKKHIGKEIKEKEKEGKESKVMDRKRKRTGKVCNL